MNIIAEVGSNWKDLQHAYHLINQLASIGICKIKFQLFTKELVKDLPEYHSKVLTEEMARLLLWKGTDAGVDVFFTPMYPEAVDICERIGVKYYKIRYADRFNEDILQKVYDTGKPTFISADKELVFKGDNWITLFCVPKYPATFGDYYKIDFDNFQGISDHTPDLELFNLNNYVGVLEYFEMHVKEDDNCLESAWSKKISDIAEVIA